MGVDHSCSAFIAAVTVISPELIVLTARAAGRFARTAIFSESTARPAPMRPRMAALIHNRARQGGEQLGLMHVIAERNPMPKPFHWFQDVLAPANSAMVFITHPWPMRLIGSTMEKSVELAAAPPLTNMPSIFK